MSLDEQKTIEKNFRTLGINTADCRNVLKAYFFLQLLGFSKPESIPDISAAVKKFSDIYEITAPDFSDRAAFFGLTDLLKKAGVLNSVERFVSKFLPGEIADILLFHKLTAGFEYYTKTYLVVLAHMDESEDPDLWQKRIANSKIRSLTTIDRKKFSDIIESVRQNEMKSASVRMNPNVVEVQKEYEKRFVPLESLLDSVLTAKLADSRKAKSEDQWLYYTNKRLEKIIDHDIEEPAETTTDSKKSKRSHIERGLADEDILFRNGAYILREIDSTKIVATLFYGGDRNDYAFEKSVLSPLFLNTATPNDTLLIVNPCPQMVEEYEAYQAQKKYFKKVFFIVPDKHVAMLYRNQFHTRNYFCADEADELRNVNKVLITLRDYPKKELADLFCFREALAPGADIMSFMYNAALPKLGDYLGVDYHLTRLMKVDTSAVGSTPKEKCVFWYSHKECNASENEQLSAENEEVKIHEYYGIPEKMNAFAFSETIRQLSEEEIKSAEKQLLKLIDGVIKPKVKKPVERVEKPAEEYAFSKEIKVCFLSFKRGEKLLGKAYYRSMVPEKRAKYGKKMTDIIQKGLRAADREGLLEKIAELPFDKEMYGPICLDIKNNLFKKGVTDVSLKTIWFFIHEYLQNISAYRENIAREVFCGKVQSVSDLIPEVAVANDYKKALDAFEEADENEKEKYLKQLNIVLDTAIKHELLRYNPVKEILEEQRNRAVEEQMRARNRLIKRVLTDAETERMIAYICELVEVENGKPYRRYQVDSVSLMAAVRLFTGLGTKELCGLQWGDLQEISSLGFYEFIVIRFLGSDGKPVLNIEERDWLKYRRIPVANFLMNLLEGRLEYLQTEYELTAKAVREHPIMVKNEKQLTNAAREVPDYCPLYKAMEGFKRVMDAAKIRDKNILFPDQGNENVVNLSKNQNIYSSNFKHQATHVAGLTHGETNYLLGLTPPTTFAKHYCDYTNDFIQLRMYIKLNRWAGKYCRYAVDGNGNRPKTGTFEESLTGFSVPSETAGMDIIIDAERNLKNIIIENEYGLNGNVTIFPEERGDSTCL